LLQEATQALPCNKLDPWQEVQVFAVVTQLSQEPEHARQLDPDSKNLAEQETTQAELSKNFDPRQEVHVVAVVTQLAQLEAEHARQFMPDW